MVKFKKFLFAAIVLAIIAIMVFTGCAIELGILSVKPKWVHAAGIIASVISIVTAIGCFKLCDIAFGEYFN